MDVSILLLTSTALSQEFLTTARPLPKSPDAAGLDLFDSEACQKWPITTFHDPCRPVENSDSGPYVVSSHFPSSLLSESLNTRDEEDSVCLRLDRRATL